jgi:hypothetical protein
MEPIVTPQKTKPDTFWWQKVQLVRAISLGIYTYLTTFDGLGDPKVAALGGKPLLYAILTFSAFDMFFAIVKAWPRRFWVFWNVRDWDALQSISSVWAIIADHELVLDIIPLIGNFALRIYSYRMTELIEDPAVKDTISTLS